MVLSKTRSIPSALLNLSCTTRWINVAKSELEEGVQEVCSVGDPVAMGSGYPPVPTQEMRYPRSHSTDSC